MIASIKDLSEIVAGQGSYPRKPFLSCKNISYNELVAILDDAPSDDDRAVRMTDKAEPFRKMVKRIESILEIGHIDPVCRRQGRRMDKANVVFLVDIRKRPDICDGVLGQMLLRPFNGLLGVRIESRAGFVLDRNAIVVTDQAQVHVFTHQIYTFVSIDSITDNIT